MVLAFKYISAVKWFGPPVFRWKQLLVPEHYTATISCAVLLPTFPKLEMFAQATNFQSNNNIYNKMAVLLKGPKNYVRGWFKAWKALMKWCIASDRNYFKCGK